MPALSREAIPEFPREVFLPSPDRSASEAKTLPSLPGRSRRARTADCLATSFGPSSMRRGTPRISQSLNFQPGLWPSRSSSVTRMLAFTSCALISFATLEDAGFFFVVFEDGHDDDLIRRELGRQHEALIVAVDHDDCADHARGKSPGSRPAMLLHAGLIEVLHFKGLREILTEEMRRARLQGFAVAHHGFDGIGDVCACEFFGVGFLAGDYRDCGFVYGEVRVDVEHLARFVFGFLLRWRGRCGLPASKTRACGERVLCGVPSGLRNSTGSSGRASRGRTESIWTTCGR